MKKIAVVGSINIDFVLRVKNFPKKGETIHSSNFFKTFGGKGANQAIALGKLEADVTMFGKVGADELGKAYIENFKQNNVKTDFIEIDGDNTGIAIVTVDDSGANNITIAAEANALVDKSYIDKHINTLSSMDIILLQLEIPLDTTFYVLEKVKKLNKDIITILDPAPATKLPKEIFQYVDYITPNETETATITDTNTENLSDDIVKKSASVLLDYKVKNAIIKAGKIGAYIFNDNQSVFAPTYDVKTIDTTAAGDSFNAGFAKGLSLEQSIEDSMMLANAVASLATTGLGAQTSMPTYKESIELIQSQANLKANFI